MTNQNSDQSRQQNQQNQSGKQDQQKSGQQSGQQQGQHGQQGQQEKSGQNQNDQAKQGRFKPESLNVPSRRKEPGLAGLFLFQGQPFAAPHVRIKGSFKGEAWIFRWNWHFITWRRPPV